MRFQEHKEMAGFWPSLTKEATDLVVS